MNKFPTMSELAGMSLPRIRLLDIQTAEQEAMVQVVVNQKVQHQPIESHVYTRDVPNIMNGTDEAKWQKILDERREKAVPKMVSMAEIIPDGEVEIPEIEEFEEHVKDAVMDNPFKGTETKSRFCEFCDSRGVRHKKDCIKN